MGAAIPLIAIIDDDIAVRHAISNLLQSAGFRTASFASAEEFLALESTELDCLIVDVRLPGMDGLELHRTLASGGRNLPVILVSGHATETMRQQALAGGAADFLAKPFADVALVHSLNHALKSQLSHMTGAA